MKISKNNKNDLKYETMFDALINEVFGFSFDIWLERKLWGERYVSYSIIENEKMLANICVFDTDMIVNGKQVRAIQLGAVCTSLAARGRGFSRLLMDHVLLEYENIPAFLFANESVLEFYPRYGFRQVQTYRPVINTAINNNTLSVVKLDVDDPILFNTIKNRYSYSKVLDCLNTGSTNMFHLLKDYHDDIYHLPGSDVIIVAYQEANRLFIADVISSKPVIFETILPELPFNGIELVEFGFCPDWLEVVPVWESVSMSDVMFFIKGNWDLPEVFRFPAMSET